MMTTTAELRAAVFAGLISFLLLLFLLHLLSLGFFPPRVSSPPLRRATSVTNSTRATESSSIDTWRSLCKRRRCAL